MKKILILFITFIVSSIALNAIRIIKYEDNKFELVLEKDNVITEPINIEGDLYIKIKEDITIKAPLEVNGNLYLIGILKKINYTDGIISTQRYIQPKINFEENGKLKVLDLYTKNINIRDFSKIKYSIASLILN